MDIHISNIIYTIIIVYYCPMLVVSPVSTEEVSINGS